MFVAGRVADVLEGRREAFQEAAEHVAIVRGEYLRALDRLEGLTVAEVDGLLTEEPWPGARPTRELGERGLVIPFGERWNSAEEARDWALGQLHDVPTVAIDGSQVAASKEFAVPVSLVQVAWFENYHRSDRQYVKDVANDVVTSDGGEDEVAEYVLAESKLNQRRFELEMTVATERMRSLPPDPTPVMFVDGSLVLSFIGRMMPRTRAAYLASLLHLLDTSRECRIPVLGYIDLSYAADLAAMLRTAFDVPKGPVFDAQIVGPRMDYFDRTAAFQCARGDVLPAYQVDGRDFSHDLCFVYLKTGADRLPARIDFPRWILDAGLLDHMLDIVRAEVVVGSGYPYALETADAAAVLTTEDRIAFYRLFWKFAESAGLDQSLPAKSSSKIHRR